MEATKWGVCLKQEVVGVVVVVVVVVVVKFGYPTNN